MNEENLKNEWVSEWTNEWVRESRKEWMNKKWNEWNQLNEWNEWNTWKKKMNEIKTRKGTNERMNVINEWLHECAKSERTNEWMLFWGQVHSQRTFGTHKVYTCDSHDN